VLLSHKGCLGRTDSRSVGDFEAHGVKFAAGAYRNGSQSVNNGAHSFESYTGRLGEKYTEAADVNH
jgi:hypothetical protein